MLELSYCPKHGDDQLPRWRLRVHSLPAKVEDAERDTLAFELGDDRQQVRRRARQSIQPQHNERITFADEVERCL